MPADSISTRRARSTNRFEAEGAAEAKWHVHASGQFILVESGISHLRTELGSWIIPTRRVGWVPPRLLHAARGCTATPCSIGTETWPVGQWVRTLDAGKIACAVALAAAPYQQC